MDATLHAVTTSTTVVDRDNRSPPHVPIKGSINGIGVVAAVHTSQRNDRDKIGKVHKTSIWIIEDPASVHSKAQMLF